MPEGKRKPVLSDEQKRQNNMKAHKRYLAKNDFVEFSIRMKRTKREQIKQYAESHNFRSATAFAEQAMDHAMDIGLKPSADKKN